MKMLSITNTLIHNTARHAIAAYDVPNLSSLLSLKADQFYSADDISGYIIFEEGKIIIAIAGSNNPRDWLINLNFRSSKFGIHKGYWGATRSIKSCVDKILKKYPAHLPLVFTGHSSGGAIAGILALFYSKDRFVKLVTFGSPKWSNSNVANRLGSQVLTYYRVVNPLDPVPYLPWFKYCHTGKAVSKSWLGNPHSMVHYRKSVVISYD